MVRDPAPPSDSPRAFGARVRQDSRMQEITLDRLPDLRAHTDRTSSALRRKLDDYLATLGPLLVPQRILGKVVSGADGADSPGAQRALKQLQERYAALADGYGLPRELRTGSIVLERDLLLHPWTYTHRLSGEAAVRVTSPVRWVLTYRSAYTPEQVRETLETRRDRRASDLIQFLVGALALQILLEAHPAIGRLLHDLRFEVITEPAEGAGGVPLTSLRAAVPSHRPADDLIQRSVQLSGVPAFIELIDPELTDLPDPLRESLSLGSD